MGVFGAIKREFDYVSGMLRVLREIRKVGAGSGVRVPDKIEATVDRYPDRPMALLDDGEISYRQFDAYANRVAHWALDQGLKPGDTVALFMSNRWEYIAIWFGLSKVGVVTSLLNNQLSGASLAHCLNIGETRHAIIADELVDAYRSACDAAEIEAKPWVVDGAYDWSGDFNAAVAEQSGARIPAVVYEILVS